MDGQGFRLAVGTVKKHFHPGKMNVSKELKR
jgi:hypothetical protein